MAFRARWLRPDGQKGVFALLKSAEGKKSVRGPAAWVAVVMGLIMLSGCGSQFGLVKDNEDNAQRVFLRNPPKTIAILPFGNQTEAEGLNEFVRTAFYSHFSAHPYKDIELHDVDRKLRYHNLMSYEKLTQTSARRLGQILRADAVVIGQVTEYQEVYAGIYSQMAVGASITVWDARTGKKIWTDEHVTRHHEGGIPLALTDIAMIGIRSGLNLTESEKVKTVDELSRHLTSRVPIPDVNGHKSGPKFVSLKRLTKTNQQTSEKNQTAGSPKLRSLKKMTKVNHQQYR